MTAKTPITLPAIWESNKQTGQAHTHTHTQHGHAGEKTQEMRQNSLKESAVTTQGSESASAKSRRQRTISSGNDITGAYVVSVGNKSATVFIIHQLSQRLHWTRAEDEAGVWRVKHLLLDGHRKCGGQCAKRDWRTCRYYLFLTHLSDANVRIQIRNNTFSQ